MNGWPDPLLPAGNAQKVKKYELTLILFDMVYYFQQGAIQNIKTFY